MHVPELTILLCFAMKKKKKKHWKEHVSTAAVREIVFPDPTE